MYLYCPLFEARKQGAEPAADTKPERVLPMTGQRSLWFLFSQRVTRMNGAVNGSGEAGAPAYLGAFPQRCREVCTFRRGNHTNGLENCTNVPENHTKEATEVCKVLNPSVNPGGLQKAGKRAEAFFYAQLRA